MAREVIVPFEMELPMTNVTFIVPQRGDKKKLLDLSEMNAKQYKVDKLKKSEKLNPEQRTTRLLKEIQEALHLDRLPAQIECFDNSNISGTDAVAGCIVFKGMKNESTTLLEICCGCLEDALVAAGYRRADSPARPNHNRRWKGANGGCSLCG